MSAGERCHYPIQTQTLGTPPSTVPNTSNSVVVFHHTFVDPAWLHLPHPHETRQPSKAFAMGIQGSRGEFPGSIWRPQSLDCQVWGVRTRGSKRIPERHGYVDILVTLFSLSWLSLLYIRSQAIRCPPTKAPSAKLCFGQLLPIRSVCSSGRRRTRL